MSPVSLIPQPAHLSEGAGAFVLNGSTRIQTDAVAEAIARQAAEWLSLPVEVGAASAPNTITFETAPQGEFHPEGYSLQVTPERVIIRASGQSGLFYGAQTLRQLVEGGSIPAVTIQDAPRFGWRGLHLDVGRYFFPVEFVKRFIDWMSLYKYNIFHWHLTEDQGWRIEIKQYPRLTEIGSKRDASPYPADRKTLDGVPHGGYYTQDEVREVVAYAQARQITVVPEIEMPGHALAALASYPELGCVGQGYSVRTYWGIAEEVFCAGNEDVYTFLQNVLDEVLALFPSEYIHIGGDECPKVRWQACPKCQAAMQREGLKDEHELQSYFIRRFEQYLNGKGRRLLGWDEILEGGLAPNATVMSWRGSQGGIDAATAGHDVVMTPNTHCYFDYYQAEDRSKEPPTIGGFVPLEKVYAFEPTEGIPADQARHVLGGQGNIWTEYMPTTEIVEYMAYPRALAMAEVLWSSSRDYADFLRRLRDHLPRLDALGIHYRNPFA